MRRAQRPAKHHACLTLVVPTLLTLVAVAQLWLATFHHLTPWKGGGFGMFATLDGIPSRFIVITATDDSGEVFLVRLSAPAIDGLDGFSRPQLTRLRALPSVAMKQELARTVVNANLVLSSRDSLVLPTRLARDPQYANAFQDTPRPARVLEILGPVRVASSFQHIRRVSVAVYRIRFHLVRDEVSLDAIGPPAVAERSAETSLVGESK